MARPIACSDRRVLADRIRTALDGLPFDQRTALVLREIDGLSYDEIGFSLGIAVGTVKSRLAQGTGGPSRGIEGRMRLLTCAAVRRRLAAFHDRELPVGEMICLREPRQGLPAVCRRARASSQNVGEPPADGRRAGTRRRVGRVWRSGVVGRMCAEDHESLRARFGRVFEDMHLVWIGLASTTATFLCGAIALGTLQFASPERHDSMAARDGRAWRRRPAPI